MIYMFVFIYGIRFWKKIIIVLSAICLENIFSSLRYLTSLWRVFIILLIEQHETRVPYSFCWCIRITDVILLNCCIEKDAMWYFLHCYLILKIRFVISNFVMFIICFLHFHILCYINPTLSPESSTPSERHLTFWMCLCQDMYMVYLTVLSFLIFTVK